MWQPHPSLRHHVFRESWHEVPPPDRRRDVLIFVYLKSVHDLMRQTHDNTMHWTSCDTLPLLGRQEENALFTFSVLITTQRLETFSLQSAPYGQSTHLEHMGSLPTSILYGLALVR